MQSKAATPDEYMNQLPEDRVIPMQQLRDTINQHLPEGFKETMGYGMLGWVVPHTIFPDGYHCDPKLPLPFISLASQKNYISLYHMGLYEGPLLSWFLEEWYKHNVKKPDLGKCCLRFKKTNEIPYELIAKLAAKMSCSEWIDIYTGMIRKK